MFNHFFLGIFRLGSFCQHLNQNLTAWIDVSIETLSISLLVSEAFREVPKFLIVLFLGNRTHISPLLPTRFFPWSIMVSIDHPQWHENSGFDSLRWKFDCSKMPIDCWLISRFLKLQSSSLQNCWFHLLLQSFNLKQSVFGRIFSSNFFLLFVALDYWNSRKAQMLLLMKAFEVQNVFSSNLKYYTNVAVQKLLLSELYWTFKLPILLLHWKYNGPQ